MKITISSKNKRILYICKTVQEMLRSNALEKGKQTWREQNNNDHNTPPPLIPSAALELSANLYIFRAEVVFVFGTALLYSIER